MKKNFHVLILTSWYPQKDKPFLGNFVRQYAETLSDYITVTVVALEPRSGESAKYHVEKTKPNFTQVRFYYSSSRLGVSKIMAHRRALQFVQKHEKPIDVIHAQVGLTNWWHFLSFQTNLNLPLLYTEHGSFYLSMNVDKLSFWHKKGLKRLVNKSDEVVAVSEVLKDAIRAFYPKDIQVIGNFIPQTWASLPIGKKSEDNNYRFLHISTLNDNKNPVGILDAVKILLKAGINDFSLTIVSDESLSTVKEYAVRNKIDRCIRFLGPFEHFSLPEIYQNHDCFLLNSNKETFSIVLAEAMHFGLHIISTPVGFLAKDEGAPFDAVSFQNPIDLSEKMKKSIEERKFSGEKSRRFIAQFQEEKIMQTYLNLYEKVKSK